MPARPGLAMPGPERPSIVDLLDEQQCAVLVEALRALFVSAAKNRAARAAAPDAEGPSSVPRTTAPTAAR